MTGTEKVLQRKDGSSLIVGVLLGLVALQFVLAVAAPLSAKILNESGSLQATGFKDQYLAPLVALLVQVILVEILVWVVVGIRMLAYPKTTKKRK